MAATDTITLFHAPNSRSLGTLTLLEELGAPYELNVLNIQAGEQRQPAYLAVNPLGKVPAIRHGDAVVTEQVAIYIYLADLFAAVGSGAGPDRQAARTLPALDGVLRGLFRAGDGGQGDEAGGRGADDVAIRQP